MAWRMLALVAFGELLGMTLWFSATAAAPAMALHFSLGPAGTAWLTMAVQAGFVVGTLASALINLADIVNARQLVAIGCAAGALFNAAATVVASPAEVIAMRFLTGVALACVYPPGLKIAAGWFVTRRGTAMGILVGALTVGSAVPHLLAWSAAIVNWRALMVCASGLALAGGLLVVLTVRDGPYVAATSRFDAGAVAVVVRNRGARLATLGYLGHMWELYAMWTWIGTFAAASYAAAHVPVFQRAGSLVAFTAIASGAVGCILAGSWADRFGKARVAGAAMVLSAACSALAGLTFGSAALIYALAIVWGFSVVADSAQFSALVAEHSPRDHVGTALTIQTCAGFLLTMVTLRLVPAAAATFGWRWAFVVLVPGPLLGTLAMRALARPTSS